MLDPFSLPFIGAILGGIVGNPADRIVCQKLRQIKDSLANDVPANGHLKRAVRKACIQATRCTCYALLEKLEQLNNPYAETNIRQDAQEQIKQVNELLKWLNKELTKTFSDNYIPPDSLVDSVEELLKPANKLSGEHAQYFVNDLKAAMSTELENTGLTVPNRLKTFIQEGWTGKDTTGQEQTYDWFEVVCGFFEWVSRQPEGAQKKWKSVLSKLEG